MVFRAWQALCLAAFVGGGQLVESERMHEQQLQLKLVRHELAPKRGPQCQSTGQYLAHEKYCRRFYHCSNQRFELQCAAGTIWDPNLPGCNFVGRVEFPTPAGCPDLKKPISADEEDSEESKTNGNSDSTAAQSSVDQSPPQSQAEANAASNIPIEGGSEDSDGDSSDSSEESEHSESSSDVSITSSASVTSSGLRSAESPPSATADHPITEASVPQI